MPDAGQYGNRTCRSAISHRRDGARRAGRTPGPDNGSGERADLPTLPSPVHTIRPSVPAAMRLLLVEDDPEIARELLLRWASRPWLVHHARTLEEAEAERRAHPPDMLLLDLGLPDGDGLAWLQSLRAVDRRLPVLVLTARDRVADRVRGLQAGADDYLVKPFAAEELEARIEVLARRANVAGDTALRYGRLQIVHEERRVYVEGAPLELSPREYEVLDLLVSRAPRLVSKRAIVDALAEGNADINDTAAELYVSRLRRRLEHTGVLIRTLRGVGYQIDLAPTGAEPAA